MALNGTRWRLAAGIAALSILPYLNGVRHGFTFDDVPLAAANPRIRPPVRAAAIVATDWWDGARPRSLLWRPLTMATFALDAALVPGVASAPARLPDGAATPFHVQNVLWHAAASVALLLLVLEAFGSVPLAGIAAALFAVHPVHAEAVNGIVGRAEAIAAAFGFLALAAAVRGARAPAGGWRTAAASGALLFAALLGKEQAIALPAVVVVAGLAAAVPRPALGRILAAQAIAVAAYLALRTSVVGSLTGVGAPVPGALDVDNPIAGAVGVARWLTPVRVFGESLRLLVFPKTLSADYSYDQIPLVTRLDAITLASAAALVALAAVAVALRRRAPAVALGLAFLLATWALTSNVFVPIGTILGERLLYLPSAGACLAAAAALVALGARTNLRWLAPALAGALVVAGAARTWARNPDWKDNLALFESTTRTSPRSCKAWNGYASELYARGRAREGLAAARRALEIAPAYPDAHQTIAKIDRALAREAGPGAERDALRAEANDHARRLVDALSASGGSPLALADAWNTIGALALDAGDVDAAETAYRTGLGIRADGVASINGLGVVLSMRAERAPDPGRREGLLREALAAFDRASAFDPGYAESRENAAAARRTLAATAADAGAREEMTRRAAADEAAAAGVRGATEDAASLANRHGAQGARLLAEGRHAEALAEFREAARLQPADGRPWIGIGSVAASQADAETEPARKSVLYEQAIAAFTRAAELAPNDPDARLDLAVTELRLKRDPATVARHFREYLRLAPSTPLRAQVEQTIREMDDLAARGGR